ncbi:DUF6159 family protein [Lysobacter sp. A03]|uniref:DUF6159 family protein n=1 Tax=Lysobacter sp. A03 TaxID=1199154 RepID=UPI0005B6E58C|nr:DUF6159 family protein [Lysobacter sp. A03]KIQ96986.1 hypothetical protein TI01_1442 [Lysobacter sp. A03]
MFERFERSWELVKPAVSVLMTDRKLWLFPLLSGLSLVLIFAVFLSPSISTGLLEAKAEGTALSAEAYVLLFIIYLLSHLVINFFNVALVGAAMIRFDGREPTLTDGFEIALIKLPAIFGYSFICAAISIILDALEERVDLLGRLTTALLGLTWTVTSFLVIPVIVHREVGPVDALKESVRLLSSTWGENLIGQIGFEIAACAGCALFVWPAVFMYFAGAIGMGTTLVLIYAGLLVVWVSITAVKAIYSAALYRYATQGDVVPSFDDHVLASAFAGTR